MQGVVAGFFRTRKAWCYMLVLLMLPMAVPPALAQALSRFSGIWVVDVEPTAAVWKKAGHPLDKATQNLLSAYRLRVDFTDNRLEEGIIVGEAGHRNPFEIVRQDKETYTLAVQGKTPKVFVWQPLDDGRVRVAVRGAKEPPLYMVREKLVRSSGVWRLEDPVVAGIALRKAGKKEVAREKEKLADLRIRVDFDAQELEWASLSGRPVLEGPEGAFVVSGRVNGDFTLSFSQGAMLWREDARGRAVVTIRDITLAFVKEASANTAKPENP